VEFTREASSAAIMESDSSAPLRNGRDDCCDDIGSRIVRFLLFFPQFPKTYICSRLHYLSYKVHTIVLVHGEGVYKYWLEIAVKRPLLVSR